MSTKIRHLESKVAFLQQECDIYCATVDTLSQRIEEVLKELQKHDKKYVEKMMRMLQGKPEPEEATQAVADDAPAAANDAAPQVLDESNVQTIEDKDAE